MPMTFCCDECGYWDEQEARAQARVDQVMKEIEEQLFDEELEVDRRFLRTF